MGPASGTQPGVAWQLTFTMQCIVVFVGLGCGLVVLWTQPTAPRLSLHFLQIRHNKIVQLLQHVACQWQGGDGDVFMGDAFERYTPTVQELHVCV